MILTIQVISYKGEPLASPLSAVFDKDGGTLGRSSDNHLVLADNEKFISSEHAIIKYENEGYYYIDTSLNGTQITNRNIKIHNNKILLKDQDALQIGDYDLIINISGEASDAPLHQSHSNSETLDSAPPEAFSLTMFDQLDTDNHETNRDNLFESEQVDITSNNDKLREDPNSISTVRNEYCSPINENFTPPEPDAQREPASNLPEDLKLDDFFLNEDQACRTLMDEGLHDLQSSPFKSDQASEDQQADELDLSKLFRPSDPSDQQIESKQPVQRQAETHHDIEKKNDAQLTADAGEADDLFTIFLKAAGVEDLSVFPKDKIPEFMRTAGTVFRELVDGLMTVMRGRAELKSHLRVSMTIIKPSENNPLKFSPTAETVLKTLLTNSHPGFVNAVNAVREGFEDIMNHQLAINAGVQASLENILKRFDPQTITEKFEEGFILQKKAKYWDEYRQAYQQIVNEAIDDFFGDDFVRAYDAQINKLHTSRKLKRN